MPDDQKFFYSNAVEAGVTPYDISLKFLRKGTTSASSPAIAGTPSGQSFGQNLGGMSGGKDMPSAKEVIAEVLDTMTIAMSPSHAKAMVSSLWLSIVAYEKTFGSIPLTAEDRARWDATFGGAAKP